MKTLLFTFALLTGSFFNAMASSRLTAPGDSAMYTLTIQFTNVTQRAGILYVGLVNDAADFNGSSYRKTRVVVPATGAIQANFEGLPAGKYAVKFYQDLNANMKLDYSGQIPAEPFGFSNVTMLMAPPSFSQCAFDFNAPRTIAVSMIGQ